jgi:hypothetical protein
MTVGALPCLYCVGSGPWNQGHVLQAAFGTSWVLDGDVCATCNSHFSALDSKLIEFVREFAYLGHPDVAKEIRFFDGKIGLTRDLSSGAWLSVRVDQKGRPIPFPQLIILPSNQIRFITDTSRWSGDLQAAALGLKEYQQLIAELSDVSRLRLKRSIARESSAQPAIVRSAPRRYFLRGSSEQILDEIEKAIRTGILVSSLATGKSDAPMFGEQREPVRLDVIYDLGSSARAVAKSALNLVCAAVDRDLARSAHLDALRTFVNTGVGEFQRFVNFRFGQAAPTPEEAALSYFAKPGCHTALVTGSGGTPLVFFFLYSRLFAIVKLCDTPILARDRQVLALFDYRAQTHQTFDTQRNAAELVRTFFPAAIGNISV